jgi:hypothetical protein
MARMNYALDAARRRAQVSSESVNGTLSSGALAQIVGAQRPRTGLSKAALREHAAAAVAQFAERKRAAATIAACCPGCGHKGGLPQRLPPRAVLRCSSCDARFPVAQFVGSERAA